MGTTVSRPTLPRLKCLLLVFICLSAACLFCFHGSFVFRTSAVGQDGASGPAASTIDVVIPFVKANKTLMNKFLVCVSSMLNYLSSDVRLLRLHIIGDEQSVLAAKDLVAQLVKESHDLHAISNRTATSAVIKLISYDYDLLAAFTDIMVGSIKSHFIYKPGAYYSDSLFFFSMVLHRLLPDKYTRVVMLDVDLRFRADVGQLHAQFDRFDDEQLIGIAYEQQPVYKHIFHAYRKLNPETGVGSNPISSSSSSSSASKGFPGFNSGVLLLDLDRMRSSKQYDRLLDETVVNELALKYKFRGHLGDQDYFTLIGIEHRRLFYVIDCTWNRQLCTWWRDLGYQEVFELYHECRGQVKIFHGNGNTAIPED